MLIYPDAVAKIDAACIQSGISSYGLMTAAGRAVSACALKRYPGARRYVVLAGPGNNGGDAYITARALRDAGAEVALHSLKSGAPSSADASRALADCGVTPEPLESYKPVVGDVVVDGVFGAGLGRDVPPALATVIDRVAEAHIPVIAIDLPSGIDGRSGKIRGAAFRADVTITFARTEGRFSKHFDKDGNPSPLLLEAKQDRLENWRILQELAGII